MQFEQAFDWIISKEGGYVENPGDRGGATKYGISSKFIQANDLKIKDVKDLSLADAKQIYRVFFWNPLCIERFSDTMIKLFVFDSAVNCGKSKSVDFLQTCINSLTHIAVDGVIGNETISTCNNLTANFYLKKILKKLLISSRLAYYMHIVNNNESQRVFLRGWINRTLEVSQIG